MPTRTATEIVNVPIAADDDSTSHLAIRFDPPAEGNDEPVVLYMHGFGSRQDGEKAAFFRRRARDVGLGFCSFDFQGHGASGGSMLDLTASRNLVDIALAHDFLRTRGLTRVVLMGSSMGGASALWYAARHPDEVVAAVHIAPALELESGLARWAGEDGLSRWQRDGRLTFSNELVTCDLSWALMEDLRTYDLARLKASYRTPTLLFQGVHDASVSWKAVADFAVGCDHDSVELHLFANGDHRLLDHREHMWRLACSFLHAQGIELPQIKI